MGVEYRQFFIPAQPTYVPDNNVISRIDYLLGKWQLKAGTPKIISLGYGANKRLEQPLHTAEFGHGIAIDYPDVDGEQAAHIFGPSNYPDMADEDRYIQGITFIAGLDYRVHPSGHELYLTVQQPAFEDGDAIEPYDEEEFESFYGLYAEAYPGNLSTSPPEIKVKSVDDKRLIGGQPFLGYWRTALIMDCGKDLPKLGDNLFTIQNTQFLYELEEAMGCKLIQIGELY